MRNYNRRRTQVAHGGDGAVRKQMEGAGILAGMKLEGKFIIRNCAITRMWMNQTMQTDKTLKRWVQIPLEMRQHFTGIDQRHITHVDVMVTVWRYGKNKVSYELNVLAVKEAETDAA